MTGKKPPPWPSGRAFWAMSLLALGAAPRSTLAALGTIALGKRVRGWNTLCSLAEEHPRHYRYWFDHVAGYRKRAFVGTANAASGLALRPLGETQGDTLASVLAQLERQGHRWVVFHGAGDQFDADLAVVLGAAIAGSPGTAWFYWDEEWVLPDGNLAPWIKPDWSKRLHMARDCLTGASAVSIGDALAALKGSGNLRADRSGIALLALALEAHGRPPSHLPLILTRRAAPQAELTDWAVAAGQVWPDWRFELRDDAPPFLRVTPPDPQAWPAVTTIVPTRDRVDLLRTCLEALDRTLYPGRVEVLVVDNGSTDGDTLAYLAQLEASGTAHVLRDDGPFNFSRLNNRAAAVASGEYLCLLNNDVQALEPDWLSAMMRHAVWPGVGAVGAQLLYPDGAIQHAGVAIGVGNAAGHIQRGVDPTSAEHAAWHAVTREVTAVTAACLLVAKAHYDAVGGLDEAGFAVAFNDVDFCLKLAARGLANVYCAEARLIHAESRSRPLDHRPDQIARFERELALLQSRWQTPGFRDPRFSPLFSQSAEKCLLRTAS